MAERVGLEASIAIAEATMCCDVDVIAAYPITPQTHVVEHISELVADGDLDAEFVMVESEHSAISACAGSTAVGARTFTSTSSQGLALMHEILYIVSALRLPVVMAVANRALSGPISIWNDHSDVMAERDVGWIQTFAENAQEAYDLTIHAFRVGEDPRVSLPVMVNFDGFVLTHTVEPLVVLTREDVTPYLPSYKPSVRLDVDKPITMGPVGVPEIYAETKRAHEQILKDSKAVCIEAWEEFGKHFGRYYKPVETYKTEDADVIMVIMGALAETARSVVDQERAAGHKVGLARLRLWRPFPYEEFYAAIGGAKSLVIVDRCVSTGGPGGPVASELKGALYGHDHKPKVVEYIAGLGGRDVPFDDFRQMLHRGLDVLKGGEIPPFEMIGVRE